tara:strand:- start:444 stop:551 length:108 start_codon:yes stop_codon:yes gene_type:complete
MMLHLKSWIGKIVGKLLQEQIDQQVENNIVLIEVE